MCIFGRIKILGVFGRVAVLGDFNLALCSSTYSLIVTVFLRCLSLGILFRFGEVSPLSNISKLSRDFACLPNFVRLGFFGDCLAGIFCAILDVVGKLNMLVLNGWRSVTPYGGGENARKLRLETGRLELGETV